MQGGIAVKGCLRLEENREERDHIARLIDVNRILHGDLRTLGSRQSGAPTKMRLLARDTIVRSVCSPGSASRSRPKHMSMQVETGADSPDVASGMSSLNPSSISSRTPLKTEARLFVPDE